jgi:hypothetical protein
MNLTAAERRILLVALREFDASRESEFRTLREYHPFLRDEDADLNIAELSRKLGLEVADRS